MKQLYMPPTWKSFYEMQVGKIFVLLLSLITALLNITLPSHRNIGLAFFVLAAFLAGNLFARFKDFWFLKTNQIWMSIDDHKEDTPDGK